MKFIIHSFRRFIGVYISKKDLRRVYDIIDRNKNNIVGMDDIRNISVLTMAPEDNTED